MESNHKAYAYEASFARIDAYLAEHDGMFEEVDEIPPRTKLTYSNGFYIKHCTAMFVDIRGSSSLPTIHNSPTLSKIYRSYISEVVAVINGNFNCAEVNIVGDAVYGVFNTPSKQKIDSVFASAAQINSLVQVLNCKLTNNNIVPIKIGVGIDYGRLLMVQAGYSGSGLNEVVWMGKAVNNASNLCHHGNLTSSDKTIMLSDVVRSNLCEKYKAMTQPNALRSCYHCDVVETAMQKWSVANCTKTSK